jgi:polyisoprenoid-binding protein YceI
MACTLPNRNKKQITMKKLLLILSVALFLFNSVNGSTKYFSRNGTISFISDAPLEKIDAINQKAASVIDTETGKIEFSVLMKAFEFKKALMQEHFNENYVESDKFPKATFKGEIENVSDVNWNEDGDYPVQLKGSMTLHGVTKEMVAKGVFTVKDGEVHGNSKFDIRLSDHDIGIPGVVKDKISEIVNITVEVDYKKLEK